MPAASITLPAAVAALRVAPLSMISVQEWIDSARLAPSQMRSRSVPIRQRLARHGDVLVVRLVESQPTLVHRDLWPDLLAVAISGARWQMDWLTPQETRLLELVDAEGVVPVDEALAHRVDAVPKRLGNGLAARLLVRQTWVPGHKDQPMRALASWWRWAEDERVAPSQDEAAARSRLEAASGGARLPWHHRALRHRWGW